MDKNERGIFFDLPMVTKDGIFHSAVLTTFSMDILHFDNFLLNLLLRKKICSINVFVDINQMAEAMEWVSPSFVGHAGKKYSLTNIESFGAFHPKINFFVGDNAVMAIIGSGNLTVAGHGKNHEAFTGFMIDQNDDSQRPLIEECWQYIKSLAQKGTEYDKHRILHEIPANCSILNAESQVSPHLVHKVNETLDAALLYNDETSGILKQLSQIVPMEDVQAISVVSPYFDEQGTTLTAMAQVCPNATINVMLQHDCQMPPCKMEKHKRIFFYDFDNTRRGKKNFKTYQRLVHAKIFHFKTADKEYCLIGSANATIAGMGTENNRGINEEMCVLYISENTDFLTSLGINNAKNRINVPQKEVSKSKQESITIKHLHKLFSAQYFEGCLMLTCKNISDNEDIFIAVDNGREVEYLVVDAIKKEKLIANHNLKNNASICYLVDSEYQQVSNKIFINKTKDLESTNPSKESRNINSIISQIEADGYNGLEIAEILTDLLVGLADQDVIEKKYVQPSSNSAKAKEDSLPQAHINPEYDNDNVPKRSSSLKDRSSRLIECIEESIKFKIKEVDRSLEEQMEEEEEGIAESGYVHEPQQIQNRTVSDKDIRNIAKLSDSVLNKYITFANKRLAQQEQYKNNLLTADDLNCFSISIFAALEICILNRWNYNVEGIDSITISSLKKRLYYSLDNSIYNEGTEAFQKFVRFCERSNIPNSSQFMAIAQRAVKYAVLYGTLFFRKATEYYRKTNGNQIINGTRKLFTIFGTPSMEYLEAELAPLSERYNYEFRMTHVEIFINKVINR